MLPLVSLRKNHKQEISSVLQKGYQGILAEFFNEDGTFKEDAASKVAFLKYGADAYKELLNRKTKKAKAEAKTEAVEEIVSRGAEKKTTTTKVRKEDEFTEEKAKEIAKYLTGSNTINRTF